MATANSTVATGTANNTQVAEQKQKPISLQPPEPEVSMEVNGSRTIHVVPPGSNLIFDISRPAANGTVTPINRAEGSQYKVTIEK